ncbi:hypothetical protein B0H16DRAFT_1449557 [Mycena metata]|uniref:Uncharacterized protein n=1 Tax=Mycena metata TaxID=1033252 RepID=A0AAD7K125_9AGAR|nr:hypothetical protein B0H16DRAFT_1449557 [Mycena metata]
MLFARDFLRKARTSVTVLGELQAGAVRASCAVNAPTRNERTRCYDSAAGDSARQSQPFRRTTRRCLFSSWGGRLGSSLDSPSTHLLVVDTGLTALFREGQPRGCLSVFVIDGDALPPTAAKILFKGYSSIGFFLVSSLPSVSFGLSLVLLLVYRLHLDAESSPTTQNSKDTAVLHRLLRHQVNLLAIFPSQFLPARTADEIDGRGFTPYTNIVDNSPSPVLPSPRSSIFPDLAKKTLLPPITSTPKTSHPAGRYPALPTPIPASRAVATPYSYKCDKLPKDAEDQMEALLGAAQAGKSVHGTQFSVQNDIPLGNKYSHFATFRDAAFHELRTNRAAFPPVKSASNFEARAHGLQSPGADRNDILSTAMAAAADRRLPHDFHLSDLLASLIRSLSSTSFARLQAHATWHHTTQAAQPWVLVVVLSDLSSYLDLNLGPLPGASWTRLG